jgi:hypothetical protein
MLCEELIKILDKGNMLIEGCEYEELMLSAADLELTGICISEDNVSTYILAFKSGKPMGAIYCDRLGTLYGDRAVMKVGRDRIFNIHKTGPDVVENIIGIAKIFDDGHLKSGKLSSIEEIVGVRARPGVLIVKITNGGVPVRGITVFIIKNKRIIAEGTTSADGTVSFRMIEGDYDYDLRTEENKRLTGRLSFRLENGIVEISAGM